MSEEKEEVTRKVLQVDVEKNRRDGFQPTAFPVPQGWSAE